MPNYNLSILNDTAVNLTTYFVFANNNTSNWFGALSALCFFVIVFVSLKRFDTKSALEAASSITTAFCLFGRALLLIDDVVLIISIIVTSVVAAYIWFKRV